MSEDEVSVDLEFLYQVSWGGWKGSGFHDKCDDKGATVTLIRSTGGFVFGGFADKLWTSSVGFYCKSDKAFFFSLNIPSNEIEPTNIRINKNKRSSGMFHGFSCGPTFGGSYYLYISYDANNNMNSRSNLGNTYELLPGQNSTFLVGSKTFKVSCIEVFQII